MAKKYKKSGSILLDISGKKTCIEWYSAEQWEQFTGNNGLFRVSIDGKWHMPAGKYSFLPHDKILDLVRKPLKGGATRKELLPPDVQPGDRLTYKCVFSDRISYECDGERVEVPAEIDMVVRAVTPAFKNESGAWCIWAYVGEGLKMLPVADAVLIRKTRRGGE